MNYFLVFSIGMCCVAFGMFLQRRAFNNILKVKAIDRTAEFVGEQPYYILNREDYCRIVLGISNQEDTTCKICNMGPICTYVQCDRCGSEYAGKEECDVNKASMEKWTPTK
jgi:hypothetical protein